MSISTQTVCRNSFPESDVVYGPSLPANWQRPKKKISQSYWATEQDDESKLPRKLRINLVQTYGRFTLAYSTAVQPTLLHEGDEAGYIAFRKRWNLTFGLGDPVASSDQWYNRLSEFIDKYKRPSFVQVSHGVAQNLLRLGYYVTPMGVDTTLRLPDYSLAGKKKEWLRYAYNWVTRRGYRLVESSFSGMSRKGVADLSEAWRATRTVKRKEVRFLNRPIVLEDEEGVRKFFLMSPAGEPVAFVFLDPIYQGGHPIGYATSFKRRHPDAPQYAEHALMKHIIETLQSEGVDELRLGLSPFCPVDKKWEGANRITQWLFHRAYHSKWLNRYAYHVQGHAAYKKRFRGEEEPVFFASPRRFDLLRLGALIGLCGVA